MGTQVPKVYYINLAHRVDRRAQIDAELVRLGWTDVTRIDAVHVPERGALGCAQSHVLALKAFLATATATTTDYCIIAEDDVAFVRDPRPDLERFFADFTPLSWDVCMLASNTVVELPVQDHPYVTRVINAQTTSCYAVNRAFAPTLLAAFEESATRLRLTEAWTAAACMDILWKRLQPVSRWYCLNPRAAIQRPSYSDIEKRVTNYGV